MNRRCKNCKTKHKLEEMFITWINAFCDNNCYISYIDTQKHKQAPLKSNKAPNKISFKRKERLKGYSEADMFRKILIERQDNWLLTCSICNKQFSIEQAQPVSFAHILAKGQYKALRLFENNIKIVCPDLNTNSCHTKLDKIVTWNKREIEQKILKWEEIDLSLYINK